MAKSMDLGWRASPQRPRPLSAVVATVALAGTGGLLLGVAAGLWGRTTAGNTALVVVLAGAPALLAASWMVLVLRLRHHETSGVRLGVGAGLAAVATLATSLLAMVLPAVRVAAGPQPEPLAIAAPHAAAVVAGALYGFVLGHPMGWRGWILCGLSALLATAVLSWLPGMGYLVAPPMLALLVVLPVLLGQTWRLGRGTPWATLGLAGLAVPVVLVAGLRLGGTLAALA